MARYGINGRFDRETERQAHVARAAARPRRRGPRDRRDQRRHAVSRRLEGDHLMTMTTAPTAAEAPALAHAEAARAPRRRPAHGWVVPRPRPWRARRPAAGRPAPGRRPP